MKALGVFAGTAFIIAGLVTLKEACSSLGDPSQKTKTLARFGGEPFKSYVVEITPHEIDSGKTKYGAISYDYETPNDIAHLAKPPANGVRRFRVPEDIEALLKILPEATSSSRDMEFLSALSSRAVFEKLTKDKPPASRDFVSDYDYARLSLDDIPFQAAISSAGASDQYFDFVEKLKTRKFDYSVLEFWICFGTDNAGAFVLHPVPAKKPAARMIDGQWRGEISRSKNTILAKSASGNDAGDEPPDFLKINRIAFADVNGDGFRDVIIEFETDEHLASRNTLVLTKTSPEQKRFALLTPP